MAEQSDHRMLEREIFLTALDETDPVKREAVIDECCRGDGKLRARIECLLYHHASDTPLFGGSEADGAKTASD